MIEKTSILEHYKDLNPRPSVIRGTTHFLNAPKRLGRSSGISSQNSGQYRMLLLRAQGRSECLMGPSKGQLISKKLFDILNSSKKQMKKFDLTTMIPHVDLFSFGRI